jgi:hypothetical protein
MSVCAVVATGGTGEEEGVVMDADDSDSETECGGGLGAASTAGATQPPGMRAYHRGPAAKPANLLAKDTVSSYKTAQNKLVVCMDLVMIWYAFCSCCVFAKSTCSGDVSCPFLARD